MQQNWSQIRRGGNRGGGDDEPLLTQVRRIVASPAISPNVVAGFRVNRNPGTGAVDVTFSLSNLDGVGAVSLARNVSADPGSASTLQTWSPAHLSGYSYSDSGTPGSAQSAYYFLVLSPTGVSGRSVTVGPVQIVLNPVTAVPVAPAGISVGHGASQGGTVPVYAVVSGATGSSIRILVAGYQGRSGSVIVASGPTSPFTFSLLATGETVQISVQALNAAGSPGASVGPVPLLLTAAATAPPAPAQPTVTQIAAGNQLTWPSSPDPTVSSYRVYRRNRTAAAVTATVLAQVTATTAATVNYLDTDGLKGDYAYTITAQSASGESAQSAAASPLVLLSSAALPANTATTSGVNNASVDSVNNAGTALIRIYGPGGVGTGYTETNGYGPVARPNGTISGLQLGTQYAVVYDTGQQAFLAFLMTNYPATLPDAYAFVGYHTTLTTGAAPGSGATASAVLGSAGTVVQVNVTSAGSGYNAAEIDFSGGGGSGAQATANISGGAVASVTVTNGGSAYLTAPTVTIVAKNSTTQTGGGGASPIYNGGARYQNLPPSESYGGYGHE